MLYVNMLPIPLPSQTQYHKRFNFIATTKINPFPETQEVFTEQMVVWHFHPPYMYNDAY